MTRLQNYLEPLGGKVDDRWTVVRVPRKPNGRTKPVYDTLYSLTDGKTYNCPACSPDPFPLMPDPVPTFSSVSFVHMVSKKTLRSATTRSWLSI